MNFHVNENIFSHKVRSFFDHTGYKYSQGFSPEVPYHTISAILYSKAECRRPIVGLSELKAHINDKFNGFFNGEFENWSEWGLVRQILGKVHVVKALQQWGNAHRILKDDYETLKELEKEIGEGKNTRGEVDAFLNNSGLTFSMLKECRVCYESNGKIKFHGNDAVSFLTQNEANGELAQEIVKWQSDNQPQLVIPGDEVDRILESASTLFSREVDLDELTFLTPTEGGFLLRTWWDEDGDLVEFGLNLYRLLSPQDSQGVIDFIHRLPTSFLALPYDKLPEDEANRLFKLLYEVLEEEPELLTPQKEAYAFYWDQNSHFASIQFPPEVDSSGFSEDSPLWIKGYGVLLHHGSNWPEESLVIEVRKKLAGVIHGIIHLGGSRVWRHSINHPEEVFNGFVKGLNYSPYFNAIVSRQLVKTPELFLSILNSDHEGAKLWAASVYAKKIIDGVNKQGRGSLFEELWQVLMFTQLERIQHRTNLKFLLQLTEAVSRPLLESLENIQHHQGVQKTTSNELIQVYETTILGLGQLLDENSYSYVWHAIDVDDIINILNNVPYQSTYSKRNIHALNLHFVLFSWLGKNKFDKKTSQKLLNKLIAGFNRLLNLSAPEKTLEIHILKPTLSLSSGKTEIYWSESWQELRILPWEELAELWGRGKLTFILSPPMFLPDKERIKWIVDQLGLLLVIHFRVNNHLSEGSRKGHQLLSIECDVVKILSLLYKEIRQIEYSTILNALHGGLDITSFNSVGSLLANSLPYFNSHTQQSILERMISEGDVMTGLTLVSLDSEGGYSTELWNWLSSPQILEASFEDISYTTMFERFLWSIPQNQKGLALLESQMNYLLAESTKFKHLGKQALRTQIVYWFVKGKDNKLNYLDAITNLSSYHASYRSEFNNVNDSLKSDFTLKALVALIYVEHDHSKAKKYAQDSGLLTVELANTRNDYIDPLMQWQVIAMVAMASNDPSLWNTAEEFYLRNLTTSEVEIPLDYFEANSLVNSTQFLMRIQGLIQFNQLQLAEKELAKASISFRQHSGVLGAKVELAIKQGNSLQALEWLSEYRSKANWKQDTIPKWWNDLYLKCLGVENLFGIRQIYHDTLSTIEAEDLIRFLPGVNPSQEIENELCSLIANEIVECFELLVNNHKHYEFMDLAEDPITTIVFNLLHMRWKDYDVSLHFQPHGGASASGKSAGERDVVLKVKGKERIVVEAQLFKPNQDAKERKQKTKQHYNKLFEYSKTSSFLLVSYVWNHKSSSFSPNDYERYLKRYVLNKKDSFSWDSQTTNFHLGRSIDKQGRSCTHIWLDCNSFVS